SGRSLGLFHSFDLLEFQFDRRGAAEDGDADFDAAAVEVELLDDAVEAGERAVEQLHRIADLIIDADLLLGRVGLLFLGREHARGLRIGDRLRLAVGAEEAGHLRGVLDQVIDVIVHLEMSKDVAGHELALGIDALAALDLGDGLGRHLDRLDEAGEAEAVGLAHDVVADLVLEARISVDDVPAGHCLTFEPLKPLTPALSQRERGNFYLARKLRRNLTSVEKKASTPKKNMASRLVMIITMIAVATV